jgi:predicted amidohydrolase
MIVKIALMQKSHNTTISHSEAAGLKIFSPHFICFPEYFFTNHRLGPHVQTMMEFERQLKRIKIISKVIDTIVIGGTTHEPDGNILYNTSFIFDRGKIAGSYRKQNLFFTEYEKVTPGNEYRVFSAYGIRFGILICADVFVEKSFQEMKKLGARIIFIPTISPRRNETVEDKFGRDNDIFIKGARISDAVIAKVCAVKSKYREYLQARSLVADKNGIIYRINPDEEEKEMIIKLEVNI